MNDHPMKNMLGSVLEGLREIAEINTIVGDAIETSHGTVIIPVSKVSVGFGLGGTDLPVSTFAEGDKAGPFGGGSGGGVTIEPVAFLVVRQDDVRLVSVDQKGPLDTKLADLIPGAIDMISKFISKSKETDTKDDLNIDD